jgi:anti-sigma factor RsiW
MCDVQAKLIAWLDRELPTDEASAVERHVERCQDCRRWVARYGQVSETFDAYCDALMGAKAPRRVPRWVPVLAGAVVAASVIFLAFPRTRVEPPLVDHPAITTASVPVPATPLEEPTPRKKTTVRRRHTVPRVREYATKEPPMDTAIEIAIPAEAMFPPGAMPNGINFIADVRIAPDGSVKQVRLRQ